LPLLSNTGIAVTGSDVDAAALVVLAAGTFSLASRRAI
jgi:hypothetical protein